jgi:hypothetical protein
MEDQIWIFLCYKDRERDIKKENMRKFRKRLENDRFVTIMTPWKKVDFHISVKLSQLDKRNV